MTLSSKQDVIMRIFFNLTVHTAVTCKADLKFVLTFKLKKTSVFYKTLKK